MNYFSWLKYASEKISHINSCKIDCEVLLCFVTKKTRSYIFSSGENELTLEEIKNLEFLLNKRFNGVPIAYLIQEKEFWSLPLKVTPVSFIPRFDTEFLVEKALSLIEYNKFSNILDLGTGNGAISLALGSECVKSKIIGIDISDSVLSLAKFNAKKLFVNNVTFLKSNWFSLVPNEKFDIIISNPPYLSKNDPCLNEGDVQFEPRLSLISENDGLADIYLIIKYARFYLIKNGFLLIEHSYLQSQKVRNFFFLIIIKM